jgi:hypothetical protein
MNRNNLGLDMARYHLDGEPPVVQSTFFFQSVPYVLSTHDTFIGFCPTVPVKPSPEGPISINRPHLWSIFGAWSFTIPECKEPSALTITAESLLAELVEKNSEIAKIKKIEPAPAVVPDSGFFSFGWIEIPGFLSSSTTTSTTDPSVSGDETNGGREKDKSSEFALVDIPAGWSAILDRGLMNGYLCEAFYRRYPYEGGKWPDKPSHRRLIEYLDSDESRTLEGGANFAVTMKLARTNAEFVREFRESAESFQ